MKLETIKRNNKKKIIIGSMIVLGVVGCLTLTTTRAKYQSVQSLKLASGTIKINQYDFKIMAMYQSEDGENYTDINTMPESGYVINEEKSYCTTDNKTQVKGKLKTIDGNHVFAKLNKNDKCYIWFDKNNSEANKVILNNVIVNNAIANYSKPATDDEGVFKIEDEIYGGTSYYWRGAVTNNYLKFAGFCWRIVRINGDGTIRIIYNGNQCISNGEASGYTSASTAYYNTEGNRNEYVGWTYSLGKQRPIDKNEGVDNNIKIKTEKWYDENISDLDKEKVADGLYCNDRRIETGQSWSSNPGKYSNYAFHERLISANPTLNCVNDDIYNLKVGLITADEVIMAGATGSENTSYCLCSKYSYWTMTPYYFYYNSSNSYGASMTIVDYRGKIMYQSVNNNTGVITPVINLRNDVTFNVESDGTKNNPYIVQ